MTIFICGFMGAGKTTFLSKIKETSPENVQLLDSDEKINSLHNKTGGKLADWIASVGWDHFRRIEAEFVQEILDSPENSIVSLGGGSLSSSNLDKILGSSSKLAWLKTPFEVCFKRIEGDAHRPLVNKGEKYLTDLYSERESRYAQSHLHLDVEEQQEITYQQLLKRLELDG